ncbi:MAG: hypothetical protein ACI8QS_001822 [Planctomycetota bacterium]|jgi:hypothetical protein
MNNTEGRDYVRIKTQLDVDVRSAGGLEFSCDTQDISYQGLFLATDLPLPEGEEIDVTLWLGARNSSIQLQVQGVVTRGTNEGFGVQISEVTQGAFEHLRQLILLTSPDPDESDQQIMRDLGLSESA